MDNGLVDQDKNFLVPIMLVGAVVILALLLSGLFMSTPDYIF